MTRAASSRSCTARTPRNNTLGDIVPGALASNNCGDGLSPIETYLGKPTPDFAGSFGFNAAFGGSWELSTLFEYKVGNYFVEDLSGMFRRANSVIGRNTPRAAELNSILQNPASTAEQRLDAAVAWEREVEGLSPMSGLNGVYDASWIRWRELSLSYRMPTDLIERMGLSTATINLGVRNLQLFMLGDYTGHGPGRQRDRKAESEPRPVQSGLELPRFDRGVEYPDSASLHLLHPRDVLRRAETMTRLIKTSGTVLAATLTMSACGLLDVNNPNNLVETSIEQTSAATAVVNGSQALAAQAIGYIWSPLLVASDEFSWIGSRDAWGSLDQGFVVRCVQRVHGRRLPLSRAGSLDGRPSR